MNKIMCIVKIITLAENQQKPPTRMDLFKNLYRWNQLPNENYVYNGKIE